jgi:hypothetical protein
VLGYVTLIVYFLFLPIPATDWPPLIPTNEDRAVYWLESLNWAAREYASAAEGRGFPETLEDLNRFEKTKDSAAWLSGVRAQLVHFYKLSYRPDARDSTGVISDYAAEAIPVEPGKSARASFYMDSTGILRWTKEARAATSEDVGWRLSRGRTVTPDKEAAMLDVRIIGVLRAATGCAAAYAVLHPQRGFPRDAAEMGSQKARCWGAILAESRLGYRFDYQPAPAGPDGRVAAFELHARPAAVGKSSAKSFVVDETGFIRSTSENRAASRSDSVVYAPPVPPAQEAVLGFENLAASWLQGLNDCLADYAQKDRDGGLPQDLRALRPPKSICASPDIASRQLQGYSFSFAAGSRDSRGRIQSYTIGARPLRFGETGKRSFYTDETGVIRQTEEDRPARASDSPRASGIDPQANEQVVLDSINQIRACARSFAERSESRHLPQSLLQLGPVGLKCVSAQVASGQAQGYVLAYWPRQSATGQGITGFLLVATPVRHGWTGIRSFLADDSGVIRATKINRRPRADDPVVETLKK